ncbi:MULTISPECIES: phage integrase [Pseudomonas]|uniref:Phage integrase n=1 Tax=Pseudomonas koreensis TaxID=198620 RepID=A0AA94JH08_9PSED|nr:MULTISPECIES: tyrosine-type recombinase/integrase [Pseudomonas]NMX69378.1 tyrosine-type recombinase/integrase [Pseudomonas sp. WS 5111]RVD75975.1 Phage integrase [Pseudomonas koreensis]
MKAKITQKLINSLKPEEKHYRVFDTDQPGFFIRVQPTGHMAYMVSWARNRERSLGRVGTLTLAQARTEAARYLADAHEHGEPLAVTRDRRGSSTPSLRQFIDETYLTWFKAHNKGYAKTLHTLDNNFDSIMSQRLDAITGRDLESLRTTWLTAGNKPSTVNRKMGTISGVFSRAVDWEYLPSSPLDKIKPLKVDTKGQVRYLSKEETLNLRNSLEVREHRACLERDSANQWRSERNKVLFSDLKELAFTDHLKPMVLVSLNTGMRRGELFSLTWPMVNFHNKTITVGGDTAKTSETRHIPMNTETFNTLKAWKDQSGESAFVFPGLEGGRMEDVKSAWLKLLKEACITGFRWHDMRHDFASRLVMAGVPLNTVRDLLGHTDIKMTLRYAHLAPDIKAAAVDLL